MTEPKQDNWRTQPAFNYEFESLPDALELAVVEFFKRPTVIFLVMKHHLGPKWLVLPWSQYRTAPKDHPCSSASVIFKGNFYELRMISNAIAPDLFTAANVTDPDKADTDAKFDDPAGPGAADDLADDPHAPLRTGPVNHGLKQPDPDNAEDGLPRGTVDA